MSELEATEQPDQPLKGESTSQNRALSVVRLWPTNSPLQVPLGGAPVRLGREPNLEVVSESPLASREHAEIIRDGPILLLRDLGSTNGLFLDGKRVAKAPVVEGGVIRFADQLLMICGGATGSVQEIAPGVLGGRVLSERLAELRLVAPTDLPIIIEGETGTGKEGAAAAAHRWSGRIGRLVAINCAAIPEQLAEAELFGHARGAFTGANHARPGCFRDADGGTLFLDEVLELPGPLGTKLLRAVEQGEVIPVGESVPIRVDVRLVVASQGSLRRAADAGRFRSDLFARLDGFTLTLPPLGERRSDIPALFEHFIRLNAASATFPAIDVTLIERLVLANWPRNIRQLRSTARRLLALNPDVNRLTTALWHTDQGKAPIAPAARELEEAPWAALDESREKRGTQKLPADDALAGLLASLERSGGNLTQAAREMGMSRPRAYRLLQNAKLDLESLRKSTPASIEGEG